MSLSYLSNDDGPHKKINWSTHYVLRYLASVIVDGIWLVSVMADGICKYLKMSALQ